MNFIKVFLRGRGWLFYGSAAGGAAGALLMHLNFLISPDHPILAGMQMGYPLSIGLGMIGGVVGGAAGGFVTGLAVRENVVFSMGAALGIGIVNGFLFGVMAGIAIGYAYELNPHLFNPTALGIATFAMICAAVFVFWILRKGKRGRPWT